MNSAIESMLAKYKCETRNDYENALKEIIQEVALLALWRAKFFQHAAFCGGTALRILYGLDRFSEDVDFSLLKPSIDFDMAPYLVAIETELRGMGFNVEVGKVAKGVDSATESAFIKAGTKEHLIQIEVPELLAARIAKTDRLKIKLEVDTDPPGGFETEAKTLLQPVAFSVNTYKQPDLFAGKIHAILQRNWKGGRIKGRDYYDFVWYVGRGTSVHLSHLEQRLRQTGAWKFEEALTQIDLHRLLEAKFSLLDFEMAKKDVLPFVRDAAALELWSTDFFLSLLPLLKVS
ncbi:nucleotidyl transferase AbiEii/AbiGii toxin family protein [soil metagenome]